MEEKAEPHSDLVMAIVELSVLHKRLYKQLEEETSRRDSAATKRHELEFIYANANANANALESVVTALTEQNNAVVVLFETFREDYNKLVDVIKDKYVELSRLLQLRFDVRIDRAKKKHETQTRLKVHLGSELKGAIKQATELEEMLKVMDEYKQLNKTKASNAFTMGVSDDDAKIMAQQQRKAIILKMLKPQTERHDRLKKGCAEQEQKMDQVKIKFVEMEAERKSISQYPELLRNQGTIKEKLEMEIAMLRAQVADLQSDSPPVPPKKTHRGNRNAILKFTKGSPMRTASATLPGRTASAVIPNPRTSGALQKRTTLAASSKPNQSAAEAVGRADHETNFIREFLVE